TIQRDRDYVAKRHQYEDVGIPEYWIANPQTEEILVLELVSGSYQERATFKDGDRLSSSQLGELSITAADVFAQV
ncbi:MAG: Uma2 family endonuclease, partial [Cyanothece sp. SIO2G6]|nr:Uma2 family endonuclease [Cyanothece sp. SIO2G6]